MSTRQLISNQVRAARDRNLLVHLAHVFFVSVRGLVLGRFQAKTVIRELHEFLVGSLGIIGLCVTFTGIILILEYSHHMKLVIGNDSMIASFAMIMLMRELAPVVTALLLVSKYGAAIAAELGAMKTSEQLDAYKLLGLSAVDLFVVPRILALSLATTILAILALALSVAGGWLAATSVLNFGSGEYFLSLLKFVQGKDLVLCVVKASLFGAFIPIISATLGFRCKHGSEGVGLATTDAVVVNSIWIVILDFALTFLFSLWQ